METMIHKELKLLRVIRGIILKISFIVLIVAIFVACDIGRNSDLINVDIVLSGWNGKMGSEDNIISLKSDRSFTLTTSASYIDSCGVVSKAGYSEIVDELNKMSILSINLYHTQSCSDADGYKQTTKLMVTSLETEKSNTIRWSDCQNDPDNLDLIISLDSFRDFMRGIINKAGKIACD